MQNHDEGKVLSGERLNLISTPEAAKIIGFEESTLEAWRCRGGGPPFVKLGRAVRYRLADLNDWVESRVRNNTIERGSE